MRYRLKNRLILLFFLFLFSLFILWAGFTFTSIFRLHQNPPAEIIKIQDIQDINLLYYIEPASFTLGRSVVAGVDRETKSYVAIKIVPRWNNLRRSIRGVTNEALILKMAAHPGICRLEKFLQTSETLYVVMEKLHRELDSQLEYNDGQLEEREAKFLVAQIVVALRHLHRKNIIHRDVSLQNVLLTSELTFPQVKLCDFHMSLLRDRKLDDEGLLPGERLNLATADFSSDTWRLGTLMYRLLSGRAPLSGNHSVEEKLKNRNLLFPQDVWKDVSSKAIDLIGHLVVYEPKQRITIEQVIHHDWFYDRVLFEDLKKLEQKVGIKYLVHEFDRKT